jgi:hypothetical protein
VRLSENDLNTLAGWNKHYPISCQPIIIRFPLSTENAAAPMVDGWVVAAFVWETPERRLSAAFARNRNAVVAWHPTRKYTCWPATNEPLNVAILTPVEFTTAATFCTVPDTAVKVTPLPCTGTPVAIPISANVIPAAAVVTWYEHMIVEQFLWITPR